MKKTLAVSLSLVLLFSALSFVSFADDEQSVRIVDTVFPTDDIVFADIVLTEAPYNADSTGERDCTEVLQRAIDRCAANGGGTVFLPKGKYRITSQIYIRNFVAVRGDYNAGAVNGDFGTVIIADVPSADDVNPALFRVGGSAGAKGLTIWYPDQSADDVKPYPFTFYADGRGSDYMLSSIIDCTLLNSYRGIGACAEWQNGISECHEMLTIENVRGTCLYEGLSDYNSADVDTVKSLRFSGEYWAAAGEEYNAPSLEKINGYTKEHLTAFLLGDLEWPEMCDISADSCKYGIYFANGPRAKFSGTFLDLRLTNCKTGIFAENGAVYARGRQWGYSVCNGVIEADGDALNDCNKAVVMLTNVKISGRVRGRNIHRETASTDKFEFDYNRTYFKPVSMLYTVDADRSGLSDVSAAVQAKLDEAAATGGTVYLPGGVYRFDNPVTVPSGVVLRGSSSVAARDCSGNSSGTLILSYYGYDGEDTPLITVEGSGGVSGLRVNFLLNLLTDGSGEYKKTPAAISVTGDDSFVTNCCIIQSCEGIVVDGAEKVFIRRNVGCCYENFITVRNCSDVHIEGCLQNGNALPRNGFASLGVPELRNGITEDKIFDYYFIPVGRKNMEFLRIYSSDGVQIINTFIYGGKCYMVSEDSSVLCGGIGSDGSSKEYYTLNTDGGEVTVIGLMRSTSDGKDGILSYRNNGTKLRIYDRISVDLSYNEFTVLENIPREELERSDIFVYLCQWIIRIYEKIGGLVTKAA